MHRDGAPRASGWLVAAFGALVAALLVIAEHVEPTELASGFIAGPLVFVLFATMSAAALTALHESSHAVVGRLVGCEILWVAVGRGRKLFEAHIGGAVVEVRQTLIGGFTAAVPTTRRSGQAAFVLAGVAAECAVIAAALWWWPSWSAIADLRWALIAVAALDIALNLWPRTIVDPSLGALTTDGGQLLELLRDPAAALDTSDRNSTIAQVRVARALYDGAVEQAVELARAHATEHPDDPQIGAQLGTVLVASGAWHEGLVVLAPLAERPDADPIVCNNAAWAAVMTFEPTLLAIADRFSARALAARPELAAVLNTRGAALVMLGRSDEGLPLLEQAAAGRIAPAERALVLAFTALAEHGRGRHHEAWAHVAAMDRLDAACPARPEVIRRLTAALPPLPPAAGWAPPAALDLAGQAVG